MRHEGDTIIDWNVAIMTSGFNQSAVMDGCMGEMTCLEEQSSRWQPEFASSDGALGHWPDDGQFLFRNFLEARNNTVSVIKIEIAGFFQCCNFHMTNQATFTINQKTNNHQKTLTNLPCPIGMLNNITILISKVKILELTYPMMFNCNPDEVCLSCPSVHTFEREIKMDASYDSRRSGPNFLTFQSTLPVILSYINVTLKGVYEPWSPISSASSASGSSLTSSSIPTDSTNDNGLYVTLAIVSAMVAGMIVLAILFISLFGVLVFFVGRRWGMVLEERYNVESKPLLNYSSKSSALLRATKIIDSDWILSYDDLDIDLDRPINSHGSSSIVYRAKFRGTLVAVKILYSTPNEEPRDDEEPGDDEFMKETRVLSTLRHPNIILLIGVCLEPQRCIVTELAERGSLSDIVKALKVRNELISVKRLVSILKQVCRGMSYLHHRGIIHRDLKAANVLLDVNWVVRIADFGLSSSKDSTSGTAGGGGGGTIRWMSPEAVEGTIDYPGDVWSFGATLLEASTAELPFADIPEDFRVLQALVNGQVPTPTTPLHPQLLLILDRCFDPLPSKRPTFDDLSLLLDFNFDGKYGPEELLPIPYQ